MTLAPLDEIRARVHTLHERPGLVIDADTHVSDPDTLPDDLRRRMEETPYYFHGRPISAEELVAEMDAAGVDASLIWQNPSATPYDDDLDANAERLIAANRYIRDAGRSFPDRLLPAGWTDPKALGVDNAKQLARICVEEFGFCIVKMNPAQNAFSINHEMVAETVDHIVALGAIPAFHFGADTPYTPPEGFLSIARRHPNHPIIGVHMGGGGAGYVEGERHYQACRQMGIDQTNIFFIQSAKRDTHAESDFLAYAATPDAWRRIAVASDAPYGRQSWNFGGYRCMFDTLRRPEAVLSDEIIAGYMGDNFRRFLIDGWLRLLDLHQVSAER